MPRLFGLTVSLLAGLTACQQPITGPAGTQIDTTRIPGSAATLRPDPQYLLTTRGDYVRTVVEDPFRSNGTRSGSAGISA